MLNKLMNINNKNFRVYPLYIYKYIYLSPWRSRYIYKYIIPARPFTFDASPKIGKMKIQLEAIGRVLYGRSYHDPRGDEKGSKKAS